MTSDIIHLLPDSVANQIAAGEVIQRPASVVKELVENAIDAGATHVHILITDAGRTCIQVIDNGKGMSETDARLAFERHATSKIQKADDLFALRTMGFRGEALPSIAAVAEVELRTRRPDDEIGVSLCIAGSKVTSQEPVNCPVGANFAVRNLFFNVPARRKFLKSNQTELANIMSEFERIAIAHCDVAFTVTCNDQVAKQLAAGNFHQRIVGLFGKRIDAHLLPVHTETDLVKISGFVGTPESARKKSAQQFFVTNSRYMRHPYFARAIATAYERLIPDGYLVPFYICLEVDPAQIDVNVHPTKTEIKFTDERDIWQILLVSIREALGKFNAVPSIDFNTADKPDLPVFNPDTQTRPPSIQVNTAFNPFDTESPTPQRSSRTGSAPQHYNKLWQQLAAEALPSQDNSPAPTHDLFGEVPAQQADVWTRTTNSYIQYRGQYILTPSEQGLMLIDQHRASERILYEQYRHRMQEGKCATQGLLFPQIIQLSPTQESVVEALSEDLATVGFNISNLGGGSYSILGTPAGTEGIDPVNLLMSILDEAVTTALNDLQGSAEAVSENVHHIIANSMARKAATPVGEFLSTEDMQKLCDDLFATSLPRYTPDGKPIIVLQPHEQIDKLFTTP